MLLSAEMAIIIMKEKRVMELWRAAIEKHFSQGISAPGQEMKQDASSQDLSDVTGT